MFMKFQIHLKMTHIKGWFFKNVKKTQSLNLDISYDV